MARIHQQQANNSRDARTGGNTGRGRHVNNSRDAGNSRNSGDVDSRKNYSNRRGASAQ